MAEAKEAGFSKRSAEGAGVLRGMEKVGLDGGARGRRICAGVKERGSCEDFALIFFFLFFYMRCQKVSDETQDRLSLFKEKKTKKQKNGRTGSKYPIIMAGENEQLVEQSQL